MLVSEVMHKGVSTVQINDSIKSVAALMKRKDIGSVPVYKNERAVGFVTDRDLVVSCLAEGHPVDEPVSLAMNPELFSVSENDDVTLVAKIMREKQISRLLVVDKGENPVGMVSLKDISRFTSDEELKASVITEIKR